MMGFHWKDVCCSNKTYSIVHKYFVTMFYKIYVLYCYSYLSLCDKELLIQYISKY